MHDCLVEHKSKASILSVSLAMMGSVGLLLRPPTPTAHGDYAMLMKMCIEWDGNKVILSEYAIGFCFGSAGIQQGVEAYLILIGG